MLMNSSILKIDCFNLNNQFYLISQWPYCINQANAQGVNFFKYTKHK